MKSKRPWPYTVTGIFFVLFAIATFANIIAGWYLAHTFLWLAALYTVLNITTAIGLFRRERWLLWALSANTLWNLVHVWFSITSDNNIYPLLGLVANILLLYYCYSTRKQLRTTSLSTPLSVTFFLAWIISVGYSVYILFI